MYTHTHTVRALEFSICKGPFLELRDEALEVRSVNRRKDNVIQTQLSLCVWLCTCACLYVCVCVCVGINFRTGHRGLTTLCSNPGADQLEFQASGGLAFRALQWTHLNTHTHAHTKLLNERKIRPLHFMETSLANMANSHVSPSPSKSRATSPCLNETALLRPQCRTILLTRTGVETQALCGMGVELHCDGVGVAEK